MEIEIIKILQKYRTFGCDVFFGVFSYLAGILGFVLALFLFLYLSKKYAIKFCIYYLIIMLINSLIKAFVNRPRPYQINKQIINIIGEIGKSFPSGHMTSITIIIVFLLCYIYRNCKSKKIKIISTIALINFAIIVAISRMYLGQHYISDIFAGIIFAVMLIIIINTINNKICKKLFKKFM